MTDVVPSPTSSSWVRLNSIIDCTHPNKPTISESMKQRQTKTIKFNANQTVVHSQDVVKNALYGNINEMKHETSTLAAG